MAVTVEDVKNRLYLDGNEEDQLIQDYIDAALVYVKGAVGEDESFWQQEQIAPLADLAVKSLASTYYQFPLAMSDTQTYSVDLTVNAVIGQLRGRYAVYEGSVDDATAD